VKGSTPISADELQLAKDMSTLSLPLEWETDEGIENAIATSVRRGLPDGAIEKYVTDVRAVTKEQVEQAARQILRPDAMVWLVIGDRSKVEPELRKAGIAYKVLPAEQSFVVSSADIAEQDFKSEFDGTNIQESD
jgi:zinc protease